ncbi:5'-AMP-activated protein kinase beta subunit, interation domain-containing protein [Mycena sp. CBHHK59/15]|nr:5'-AMP-activated protein kinase beta subunit, interation domain-containing protein [Mycena sp. CBHHK59/15]
MHPHPDGSFWSARSSVGSTEDVHALERAARAHSTRTGRDGAVWTSVVPEALVRAAAQEEAFLDALAQQQAQGSGSRGRPIALNGFVPEPSIPPAPRLPRHLERLILNRPSPGVVIPRVGTVAPGAGSAANAVGTPLAPALRVTTASGTDVSVPLPSMTAVAHANANANTTPAGGASAGVALIADDPSVLQTPSHAVLYHLCTSSIRDGMIAVGASTRYRQKYLTTVYYKPANPGQRE